jgi:hypothetical protein
VLQKLLVGTQLQHQTWHDQLNEFRQSHQNNLSTTANDGALTTYPSNNNNKNNNTTVAACQALVPVNTTNDSTEMGPSCNAMVPVTTEASTPSSYSLHPHYLLQDHAYNESNSNDPANYFEGDVDDDDLTQLEDLALMICSSDDKPIFYDLVTPRSNTDAEDNKNDDQEEEDEEDDDDDTTTGKWSVMTFTTNTPSTEGNNVVMNQSSNNRQITALPPSSVVTKASQRSLFSTKPSATSTASSNNKSIISKWSNKVKSITSTHVDQTHLIDPYGDVGVFTGSLRNDKPHGFGKMQYDDGRLYEGTTSRCEYIYVCVVGLANDSISQNRLYYGCCHTGDWKYGRWHGRGKAHFANGDVYQGQYLYDQRHGYGHYIWKDGRTYIGQFEQDQRQGRGLYRWPNGSWYRGEFSKGQRNGEGEYQFADGSTYKGQVRSYYRTESFA